LKLKLKEKELLVHQLTEKNKALEKEQVAILKAISDVLCKYDEGGLRR